MKERVMRNRNLIVVGAVTFIAAAWAIIALAGQCGDPTDCLSGGTLEEDEAWDFTFTVTADIMEFDPDEYPGVYIKPPGETLWTSFTLTLWEVVTPVCKNFWRSIDFECMNWGSGQYKFYFHSDESDCGKDPNSDWHVFWVDEDGHGYSEEP